MNLHERDTTPSPALQEAQRQRTLAWMRLLNGYTAIQSGVAGVPLEALAQEYERASDREREVMLRRAEMAVVA